MNNHERKNTVRHFKRVSKVLSDHNYLGGKGLFCSRYAVSCFAISALRKLKLTVTWGSLVKTIKDCHLLIIQDIGLFLKPQGDKLKLVVVTPGTESEIFSVTLKNTDTLLIPSGLEQRVEGSNFLHEMDTLLKLIGLIATTNIEIPQSEEFNLDLKKLMEQGSFDLARGMPTYMFIDLDGVTIASRRQKKIDGACSGKKPHIRKGHFREQKFKNKNGAIESRIIWIHHCMVHPELMVSNRLFTENGGSCGN